MKKMATTSNSNNIKGSRVFFFFLSLSPEIYLHALLQWLHFIVLEWDKASGWEEGRKDIQ